MKDESDSIWLLEAMSEADEPIELLAGPLFEIMLEDGTCELLRSDEEAATPELMTEALELSRDWTLGMTSVDEVPETSLGKLLNTTPEDTA
jgi:hypothetical protein